ncbi:MAG: fumarylacetoacetate hydrolase family protein [Chlorobiales bacterium]|nr:fumarylacetoacetate hydrolase family protein [Chlorobiales bacterium]
MEKLLDSRTIAPGAIYCVGKNYPEHAREMQQLEGAIPGTVIENDVEPIIFMKPPTALETGGRIAIPEFHGRPLSANMHYEVEMVLLIGESCDGCSIEDAPKYIGGFGVGLDMTLRDVQFAAKKSGNPWLKSKGFRNSALISDFVPFNHSRFPENIVISLELNGSLVQMGVVSEMLHTPAELIHYLSYLYGLRRGDLIFTGTPAGVGRVVSGDSLKALLSISGNGIQGGCELVNLHAKVV